MRTERRKSEKESGEGEVILLFYLDYCSLNIGIDKIPKIGYTLYRK